MASAVETARKILDAAAKYGFSVEVRGSILTVSKSFTPNDVDAFRDCDMSYYSVLGELPRTQPGSDWGTDGGGIGGIVALNEGYFKMNRSGGSKRVLNALVKML